MNRRLTHILVLIVTLTVIVASLAFSFAVTASRHTGTPATRPAIPPIAHPVEASMADCRRCHVPGPGGTPPSHATYGIATCGTCHRVASARELRREERALGSEGAQGPRPVPHPAAAPYDDCVGCHAIGGNRSMPQDHADYANDACSGCHVQSTARAGGGSAPPH
jgi:cytochrome c553